MILPFMLVAASLAGLLLLLRVARGGGVSVHQFDDLVGRTRPVDLDAFRNLVDPREEAFLRECLTQREFRLAQKERLQAATEYVAKTAYNAAVLLRLGEAAMRNPDPNVAAAARRLVETSVRLRIYALLCAAKLRVRIALPRVPLSVGRLVESYQRLGGIATQLAVAHRPRYVSRLSTIL